MNLFVKMSNFEFLVPTVMVKISNDPKISNDQFFFEFDIFDDRFGISIPKDMKMGGVAIALPKNGAHNQGYSSNSARH